MAEPVIPVPQTVFGGVVQSAGTLGINTDILKLAYEDRFYLYDRNVTPILAILTQHSKSIPVNEASYKWFEDAPIPEWLGLAGAIGSTSQQNIPLTTGQGVWNQINDLVLDTATGEMMQITNIIGDTIVVTRGVNGTTAANLGATDQLLNLKTPWGQGTQKSSPYSTNPISVLNYCQTYKNSFSLAKSLAEAATYGGDQRSYQRFKLMQAHARAWEQIFIHSLRTANTSGQNPTYTTGGLDYFIKSNILSVGGPMAESDFIEFITRVNRYSVDGGGADNKILFASRAVCNAINSWGLAKLHLNDGLSQKYGVTITTYAAAGIKVNIILHPLLEQGYDGWAYLLDMNGIKRRVFRPTKMTPDIQPPGADFYQDECLTEQGFEVNQEKCHGIFQGVTF